MAATKRKISRSTAKKVGKKSTTRMQKKPKTAKSQSRKIKTSQKKTTQKTIRPTPIVVSPNKPYTKTELLSTLAGCTGLQKRDISATFDALGNVVAAHLKKQGPGQFTLPGLIKIISIYKAATKARKGINPFTGEEIMFKAKPARNVVKVRALKKLKAMV